MKDEDLCNTLLSIAEVFKSLKPWLEMQTVQNNLMKNQITELQNEIMKWESRIDKLEKEKKRKNKK